MDWLLYDMDLYHELKIRGVYRTQSDIQDEAFCENTLREKCPDTEFFLVRIFLYLD